MAERSLVLANLAEFNRKLCRDCKAVHYILLVEFNEDISYQASNCEQEGLAGELIPLVKNWIAGNKGVVVGPVRLNIAALVPERKTLPYQSGLLLPLNNHMQNYGFLLALGEWLPEQVGLVWAVIGGLVELVGRLREEVHLGEMMLAVVKSAVTAIEAKDAYTRGHSDRVAKYSYLLARRMGFDDDQAEMVRTAAILHDIGKIGVRDWVLTKKEPLTPGDWEEIRRHPELGEKILRPITLLAPALAVVRHHHERYDGSGYPDGLKGEEIPISARIVSAADAFDAMTSNRPYRQPFPADRALRELVANGGTQFDPRVVEAFRALDLKHLNHMLPEAM